MAGALILAAVLVAIGLATAVRQRATLRRLKADRFLPSEDRAYLRGQARRRLGTAAVLVLIGGMIAGTYLSGMEARADAIAARKAQQHADAPPPADGEAEQPRDPGERRFLKLWGVYWIVVVLLVFTILFLAVVDFWATRRYWLRQYQRIRDDHNTRLQRDLAVYRQQKLTAREARLKGKGGDPPAAESAD